MNPPNLRALLPRLVVAAALTGAAAVHAESLASSASSAASQSVGSLSESIQNSSRGSSGTTRTADGDYRVIEVAAVDGRPGMLRLTLRVVAAPADDEAGFMLTLPQQALGAQGVAVGDVIRVRNRAYGIEFARAASAGRAAEPFFLVLRDDWRRELDARPVSL